VQEERSKVEEEKSKVEEHAFCLRIGKVEAVETLLKTLCGTSSLYSCLICSSVSSFGGGGSCETQQTTDPIFPLRFGDKVDYVLHWRRPNVEKRFSIKWSLWSMKVRFSRISPFVLAFLLPQRGSKNEFLQDFAEWVKMTLGHSRLWPP